MWARCRGLCGSAGGRGCGACCCQLTATVGYATTRGAEVGDDAAGRAGAHGAGGGGGDGVARERGRHRPGSWR